MRSRYLAVLLLLPLWPAAVQAQEPEQLLPGNTQLYVRWDGVTAHADAYAKSAIGKVLAGDMGNFLAKLYAMLQESAGGILTVEKLLEGTPPDKLQQLQADAGEAAKLPALFGKHGFILAGEVRSLEPFTAQLTLIVPDVGDNNKPIFGGLRLLAALTKAKSTEKKVMGRTVTVADFDEGIHLAWWQEGKHAVVIFGTDDPEKVVKEMAEAKGDRLTAHPLYKRIKAFKTYETTTRAFIDVAALVKIAGSRDPKIKKLLEDLGIDGLKSAVWYSGYEGELSREIIEIDAPGPRKGVLALLNGKQFTMADVPPLPPDVASWSMTHFDAAALWDLGVPALEAIVGIFDPDSVPEIKKGIKDLNDTLGLDLRKDLLEALGDKVVFYHSPTEGPMAIGQVVMIKVKDKEKLEGAIKQVVKVLAQKTNGQVVFKKRTYHGVEMREIYFKERGFPFIPTYAIHDGWLIISLFPQPVQAYIMRSKGEMKAWKPDERSKEAFDKMPKQFLSVSWSDPRPGLGQLLSLGPLLGGLYKSIDPESTFEPGTIPNAQEVTRHLFPNVAVFVDDGKTLRFESRDSLALPLEIAGVDTYALLFLFAAAFRF
jgi:hypothetical protein